MKDAGFLLVNKPAGWTSFDVCAKIKKQFKTKRVGHTGTLDPFATGLLILAINKATKLIPFLEKATKTYETEIILGKTSATLDPESEIIDCGFDDLPPTENTIFEILKQNFAGKIWQTPPQFSAIKIKGKRAYELARSGEKIEIPSRETEVFFAKILAYDFPSVKIELTVAAGFYVRSFAKNLGEKLGTGAYCQTLKRTKINDIDLNSASELTEIKNLIDPKYLLTSLPIKEIPTNRLADFQAGRAFPFSGKENEKILCLINGESVGIGEILHEKLQPRIVL